MTKIITLVGTHCTFKTTFTQALHEAASARGLSSCVVSEVARLCPLPMNKQQTKESTMWIFNEQLKQEEKALKQNTDVLFCDRSFLDPFAYYCVSYESFIDEFINGMDICGIRLQALIDVYKQHYDFTLHMRATQNKSLITEDGFRNTDFKFRRSVDEVFLNLFTRGGIKKDSAWASKHFMEKRAIRVDYRKEFFDRLLSRILAN